MAIADTARLIASLELQDKFSQPAGRITGSLTRMESGFSQIGRGAGQVGSGLARLGTVATVAAVGGLGAIVKTSADMEEAFVGIQKTVDETVDFTFVRLREELRAMSVATGTAFEELSRIGEIGGALGVGIEDLSGFIDVVNRLGVSTDLSTDAAATALGQFRTILGLSGDDVRTFADDLVALGNAGASTEPEIAELALRFAAAGNRAGLSSGEILALSSAVASMGVNVEAGGTALSQTFNNIAKAIGTGSDDVEGFTKVLNISAAEFRTAWETDALGTFQDFLRELSKLDPIAQATALSMAGITGQRQLNAIGLMSDKWGFVGDQLDIVRTNQGDLNTESNKFFSTTAGGFRKVLESVRLTADSIGQELLPLVNDLSEEFVAFLQLDTTQAGIKTFAQDLAGGIRNIVDELKGADFSGLIEGMKLAGEVASRAFGLFRSLPPELQALAVSAIALNKISGGAVGSIAKGLGNIIGGTIKLAFPKLDIFSRGATAANPIFTREVGLGGGAGGGLLGGGGGKPSFLGTALKVTVIGAVAVEGFNIAADVAGINAPQHEGPDERGFRATNIPQQELINLTNSLDNLRERALAGDTFAAKQLAAVEARIAELKVIIAGGVKITNPEDFKKDFDPQLLEETKAARLAAIHNGEQVVGAVKTLEAAEGRHAQQNIDKLAAVISSVDRTRPALDRAAENSRQTAVNTASYLAKAERAIGIASEQTGIQRGILGKDFSPKVNVSLTTNTTVSVNDVIRSVQNYNYAIGSGPGGTPDARLLPA